MGIRIDKKLRTLMARQSLTAAQLARKSSVSKQSISDWLAGVPPSRIDRLVQVAKALDVTLDELITGNAPETPAPAEVARTECYLDLRDLINSCPACEVVGAGRCPVDRKLLLQVRLE